MIAGAADYNKAAEKNGWPSLCDVTAGFSHPDLRRLLGVWRKQAKGGELPKKSDMTPRLLKSFLGDIAFYERIATRWRVMMMGASMAQIMGDRTGRFLDEAVPQEFLPRWHASLDATLGQAAPLRFIGRADTSAMGFLHGEFFSAPLRGPDGSPNIVLGAARFSGGRPWADVEAEARKALGLS